jgi:hypothetical protein
LLPLIFKMPYICIYLLAHYTNTYIGRRGELSFFREKLKILILVNYMNFFFY